MNRLTAKGLRSDGVSAIGAILEDADEVIVTVRGKEKYVVMKIEHYQYLQECELDAVMNEARVENQTGGPDKESVLEHMRRITK